MPTLSVTRSIEIDAPVERVFQLVADPCRRMSAQSRVYRRRIAVSDVEASPDGTVTSWKATTRFFFLPFSTTIAVARVEHVPEARIVEKARVWTKDVDEITLAPSGDGTRLTWRNEVTAPRALVGFLALTSAKGQGHERQIDDNLAELKRELEAPPDGYADLPSGRTHYELRGDPHGDVVVLVHGNAAPSATWDHTIGALADAGFRVLRYDLLGHGSSDRPRLRAYDRALYNAQLEELLAHLGITGPVSLVGSSQGGSIATCFAAEHPGLVTRLALLAPFFDELPGSDTLAYRLVTTPVLGELLMAAMGTRRLLDLSDAVVSVDAVPELRRRVADQLRVPGKRRAVLANLRGDALRDATSCYQRVKEQGIAVLLTCGTEDRKIPRESISRLRSLLPDAEYHDVEGGAHLAHYEIPGVMNPILTRFLAG